MENTTTVKGEITKSSFQQRSIAQMLSLFVIVSILALGLMLMVLFSVRIGQAVSNSQQSHAQSQIHFLANDISQYLGNMEKILKDHANFPIMVQSVMQPEINQGVIQDFMDNLTFLDKPYQQVLLDFRGYTIHANREMPIFEYQKEKWVAQLTEGSLKEFRGISESENGTYYWRLAVPVIYNGQVEGVLLTEIPIDELDQQLSSEHLGGISLAIMWKDKVIKTVGENILSGKILELTEPLTQVRLRFSIDTTISDKIRNRLLIENLILLIVLSIMATIASIYLGKRWFIMPIQKLQAFTRNLADNKHYSLMSAKNDVKELQELANDFNQMADRIRRREDALQKSHDDLKEVNERLESSQLQLIQSEKMASLGTLAADVAHEINNPVSFIKSNINTLEQYLDVLVELVKSYQKYTKADDEEKINLLNNISQKAEEHDVDFILEDIVPLMSDTAEGADRVNTIISGLKSFVRMDETDDQLFNLNECVESTLKVVWNELKYKCEIHKKLSALPMIKGSPGQINQVITNLLINAGQAIPDKGEITIESYAQKQTVFLCITDTGTGISSENLKKLFTPFFTTKEIGQGTGLGLSISHGIVEQHGGSMTATSELGEGTSFTIELPAAEE